MTYRPAAQDACRVGERGWTTTAYRRRGVPTHKMVTFAECGLSPDVAGMLYTGDFSDAESADLAALVSRAGIRALLSGRRLLPVTGVVNLTAMHEQSPTRTRAWVHRTGVYIENARRMDQWGIRPSHVANWVAVDPMRRPADPFSILTVARIALGVPHDDMAGWLVFATRRNVPFFGPDRSAFLGGDTGLFVRAGLSPAEATRLVRRGPVDRDTLLLMASLRS